MASENIIWYQCYEWEVIEGHSSCLCNTISAYIFNPIDLLGTVRHRILDSLRKIQVSSTSMMSPQSKQKPLSLFVKLRFLFSRIKSRYPFHSRFPHQMCMCLRFLPNILKNLLDQEPIPTKPFFVSTKLSIIAMVI